MSGITQHLSFGDRLLHLASPTRGSSVQQLVPEHPSSWRLKSFPLDPRGSFCSSFPLSMGTWIIYTLAVGNHGPIEGQVFLRSSTNMKMIKPGVRH